MNDEEDLICDSCDSGLPIIHFCDECLGSVCENCGHKLPKETGLNAIHTFCRSERLERRAEMLREDYEDNERHERRKAYKETNNGHEN
jgi:hypothetical protein